MEQGLILLDSSVVIEYLREKDKSKTTLLKHTAAGFDFAISTITEFELYCFDSPEQSSFLKSFFRHVQIKALDSKIAGLAAKVFRDLRTHGTLIPVADIFIAATAMSLNISVSTLNINHFNRINGLHLV